MNSRIIFLDFGIFMFRPIKAYQAQLKQQAESGIKKFIMPPEWTCLAMIISNLQKVGIRPEDEVVIAADGRNSWRKDYDKNYKLTRAAQRDKDTFIDYPKMFERFNGLLEKLDQNTPFRVIKIDRFEADDVIASACKYFPDKEILIVSYDADYEMLVAYPNVKIFSPLTHKYKVPGDPYKLLAKKITREASDNLITPIISQADYDTRKLIVDLISLPDFIYETLNPYFEELFLEEKKFQLDNLPFPSIRKRFETLYQNENKIVDYDKCLVAKKKTKKNVAIDKSVDNKV